MKINFLLPPYAKGQDPSGPGPFYYKPLFGNINTFNQVAGEFPAGRQMLPE